MRDVYMAIMRAAALGKGVRLSADEVSGLSKDEAIRTRANNALSADEPVDDFDWAKCDLSKPRVAANQSA